MIAWLSGGGFIIVGACLASVATVVVILAAALCVVRLKRRSRQSCALPLTKVELQPLSSSGTTASHPLLNDDDKLRDEDDIRLREFDNEPVRYVVSPSFTNISLCLNIYPCLCLFLTFKRYNAK